MEDTHSGDTGILVAVVAEGVFSIAIEDVTIPRRNTEGESAVEETENQGGVTYIGAQVFTEPLSRIFL